MSERRRPLSRPRTKVYDCNYNIGEQYYKPVVDDLDRKYGRVFTDRVVPPEEPLTSRRSPFESRPPRPSRSTANDFEDDFESDIVSSMQKLKSSRSARQEFEDELDDLATERSFKKRNSALNAARESILEDDLESAMFGKKKSGYFQDKLLDTVGVNGKLQRSLAEESISSFKKRAKSAIDEFDNELVLRGRREGSASGTLRKRFNNEFEEVPRMTKWTALNANSFTEKLDESFDERAAKDRAKKSRARLADIEAEMDALVERGAARDKRIQGLKSFLADTSSTAEEASSVQIKQRVSKNEKKVTF